VIPFPPLSSIVLPRTVESAARALMATTIPSPAFSDSVQSSTLLRLALIPAPVLNSSQTTPTASFVFC
jgi:hypothetical protein